MEEDGERRLLIRGVGLHAPLEATGGLHRRRQRGHAHAAAAGLARRAARRQSGRSTATSRSAAARSTGWPSRCGRWAREVEAREGRFPPFTVRGGASSTGIDYELPVASAQVKSCVLIAGMLAAGSTTVNERAPSRDHTERMLRRARVPFERDGPAHHGLERRRARAGRDRRARRPLVGGLHRGRARRWCSGSRVVVRDVGLNWTRTGFLPHRPAHGGGDHRRSRGARTPRRTPSRSASSTWPRRRSRAPWSSRSEVPLAIDELTLVALLGAFAEGETVVAAPGSSLQGIRPYRRRGGGAARPRRGHRGDRGRLRRARGRLPAARRNDRVARRPPPRDARRRRGARLDRRAWRSWGWTRRPCPIPASRRTWARCWPDTYSLRDGGSRRHLLLPAGPGGPLRRRPQARSVPHRGARAPRRYVPLCPEVEIGLGVPRPPIRLARVNGEIRLVDPASGARPQRAHAHLVARGGAANRRGRARRLRVQEELAVVRAGAREGLRRERLARRHRTRPVRGGAAGAPAAARRRGGGPAARRAPARALRRARSSDTRACASSWPATGPPRDLVEFHAAEKMLVRAHDPSLALELGRLVADAGVLARERVADALRRAARPRACRTQRTTGPPPGRARAPGRARQARCVARRPRRAPGGHRGLPRRGRAARRSAGAAAPPPPRGRQGWGARQSYLEPAPKDLGLRSRL